MRKPKYSGSCYDIPAVEAWLEAQALKGWFLEVYVLGARMTQGEPRRVRYRLEPWNGPVGEPDEQQKALYEEMGWTYVCDWVSRLRVFRSTVPHPVELHTDPVAESWNYRPLNRAAALRLAALAILAMLVIGGLMLTIQELLSASPRQQILYQLTPFDWVLYLLILPVMVELFYSFWRDIVAIRRLTELLQSGLEPTGPLLQQKKMPRWLPPVRSALIAVLLVWVIAIYAMGQVSQRDYVRLEKWEKAAPVFDLGALEEERLGEPISMFTEVRGGWSPQAPQQVQLVYYRQIKKTQWRNELSQEYYRLRTPQVAEVLYDDLVPEDAEPVEARGFTQAAVFTDRDRLMFAGRWETSVLLLNYNQEGELDLLEDLVPAAQAACEEVGT